MNSWLDLPPVRWLGAMVLFLRGKIRLAIGRDYRGMSDLCRVVRVLGHRSVGNLAFKDVMKAVRQIKSSGSNFLVESYLDDPASESAAGRYSIGGGGSADIFRDIIVLKSPTEDEKGVILLKYGQTFDAAVALFKISRLTERYHFVLEPCWAGVCDPSILMFLTANQPVFVQTFTEEDYQFIVDVGSPFVPLRLGPADWVDTDLFLPDEGIAKRYDLVMVANWASHKRHAQLFRALRQIRDRDIDVLLVGFPWGGRTADDIRQEASALAGKNIHLHILERIPQSELALRLQECRVFVFLSRKEGDNKALVEAMFANVPSIVYEKTIGGAPSRINSMTGIFSSDRNLAKNIVYMLNHAVDFAPRKWALEHTGSKVATSILNGTIERTVSSDGGRYRRAIVEKTNAPNLTYKDPSVRVEFDSDYHFIVACLRRGDAGLPNDHVSPMIEKAADDV